MTNIEGKRNAEKAKYVELQLLMPSYGTSNHGAGMLTYIANNKPSFVVDFGCGRNNFVKDLETLNISAKGIDFVYDEADIIAPMHNVPLEDNVADFITAFDSLEHLVEEDIDLVLKEMQRIAQPQAQFCFSISYHLSQILVHGQNLHPTVRSEGWWKGKISDVARTVYNMGKYLTGHFK